MGGISGDYKKFEHWAARVSAIFADLAPDLELVGQLMAEAIVRTTLAGIGAGDTAFPAYSPAYQALIDSVGGKPQQTVNLRGLFYHEGQKRTKFRSEKQRQRYRADRQAFVQVTFLLSKKGRRRTSRDLDSGRGSIGDLLGRMDAEAKRKRGAVKAIAAFTAKSGVTRPARGVTDKLSEMSLDLISIQVNAKAGQESMKIIYKPRKEKYMIWHNRGEGKLPERRWFTLDKAAVKAAGVKGFQLIMKARMLRAQLDEAGQASGPIAPVAEGAIRQALNQPAEGGK